MTTLETFDANGFTVEIVGDPDPRNPREDATACTLAMKNEHWADDDAVGAQSEDAFWVNLAGTIGEELEKWAHENGYGDIWVDPGHFHEDVVEEAYDIAHEHYYITPVYCYRHSGIAMSTSPFRSSWDSGQAGLAYIRKEEAHAPDDMAEKEWARDAMAAEVEAFGQYLSGDVYGYRILDGDYCVDSCYGFYDRDYCKEEASRVAENLETAAA